MSLPVLIAESYHERAVIAKLYRIAQSSGDDRKKMIPTGRGWTSATSSNLWVRTRRSLAVHTVSVDSTEARGRGASMAVDTSDQTLPTHGAHISVRYDGAVQRRHLLTNVHSLNWMHCHTGSQWRSFRMVLMIWSNFHLLVMSRATEFNTDWS